MSQDAGMGTANFEPMPELPSSGQGAALPEGIQCTEFFLAALKAATTHGGLTPFARHSLERFPNVDGLARCKSDMWPCPPPDLGEMDELELFVTETKEKTQVPSRSGLRCAEFGDRAELAESRPRAAAS